MVLALAIPSSSAMLKLIYENNGWQIIWLIKHFHFRETGRIERREEFYFKIYCSFNSK